LAQLPRPKRPTTPHSPIVAATQDSHSQPPSIGALRNTLLKVNDIGWTGVA
jgi:hypothetical protein